MARSREMRLLDHGSTLAADLLAWYGRHHRDLPWRRAPSPYRSLVSELMLQQTVVATVVPYFDRFIARFPDFRALAAAREDDVLAAWSGLGYYARARHLHRAAKLVVSRWDGRLPDDESALRDLPGVGEYTAASVAAIAFGKPTFALDGNAARVMARLADVPAPTSLTVTRKRLRALGLSLVPRDRPGDFQQAVMELGALVCVPGRPRCDTCPVRGHCLGLAAGRAARIPPRVAPPPRRPVYLACALVVRGGRVLLVRRESGDLLAGTWALPAKEVSRRSGAAPVAGAAARAAAVGMGVKPDGAVRYAGRVRHIFTHRDVTADVFAVAPTGKVPTGERARWADAAELAGLAVSSFTRKTLRAGNFA